MNTVRDFVSGFSGGFLSTLILHPFDLVRNRQAVNDGDPKRPKYGNQMSIVRSVIKNEGARSLWRGVSPSIVGAGLSWGLYFPIYEHFKRQLQAHYGDSVPQYQYFFTGCITGALVLTLTNPIWVCKTQQCLQYEEGALKRTRETFAQTLHRLYKMEGLKGLYRGYYAGLFGTIHGGVQFFFLELFKTRLGVTKQNQTNFQMLALPAASKLIAGTLCYPQLLIRSRMQDQHRMYDSMRDCIRHTFRHEGFKGFYKGLSTNLCRTIPSSVITFYTYEYLSKRS